MFIQSSQCGYNTYGEQFARGRFLAVFCHNNFMAEEQANPVVPGPVLMDWIKADRTSICTCAGNPHYYQKSCPVHNAGYVKPNLDDRKLYAIARHCSLRQCGHWMMGTISIAGQRVTVSGAYGGDGLPLSYEELTPSARAKLVEVPKELCDAFWAGGGHNTSGSEGPAMRHWALKLQR